MSDSNSDGQYGLAELLQVMARLRDRDTGCDWDLQQTYKSIAPSTIEEAYEVVDAIEREDFGHLREELGDLLFQVVFHSRLAEEDRHFSFGDVVDGLAAKLIRRHPHVFPDGTLESKRHPDDPSDQAAIVEAWEALKQKERKAKGVTGVLDDVPPGLPALTRAMKLQKRASVSGFDWPSIGGVIEQLEEELGELREAIAANDNDNMAEEAGDLLFAAVNLLRHLRLDPETVLRGGNAKFERRFRFIERELAKQGLHPQDADLASLEALWLAAKREGL